MASLWLRMDHGRPCAEVFTRRKTLRSQPCFAGDVKSWNHWLRGEADATMARPRDVLFIRIYVPSMAFGR
jgi:hypothetical protein